MQLFHFLAMAASVTTASALPSLEKRALACPASNNTVYTTANGNQYTIECGLDRTGGDYAMVYANTLEICLLTCSLNPQCQDVSYSPGTFTGPCYLKSAINAASSNSNIMGARLGTGSTSSSTSSSGSGKNAASTTSTSSASSQSSTSTASSSTQGSGSNVQIAAVSSAASSAASVAASATGSGTASAAAAAATAFQTCGASISAIAEYPHMITRISKSNPSQGYSQVWNGTMNSDLDSVFNFDIKPSYAGKSCTLFFLPPTSDQLASSGFAWGTSGTGSLTVSQLANWVSENITLNTLPAQTTVGNVNSLAPGNNAVIYSGFCPAGSRVSYRFTATGSLALDYYQYILPYSVGVYMSVC